MLSLYYTETEKMRKRGTGDFNESTIYLPVSVSPIPEGPFSNREKFRFILHGTKVLCFVFSLFAFSAFSQAGHSPFGSGYFTSLESAAKNLEKVTALNLYDKGLSAFPQEIFSMHHLELLDLSHNNISVIPERISELKKLQSFYINHNNIADFPDALMQMKSLRILYIQANPLNDKKDIHKKIPLNLEKLESGNPASDFVSPKPEFNKPDSNSVENQK